MERRATIFGQSAHRRHRADSQARVSLSPASFGSSFASEAFASRRQALRPKDQDFRRSFFTFPGLAANAPRRAVLADVIARKMNRASAEPCRTACRVSGASRGPRNSRTTGPTSTRCTSSSQSFASPGQRFSSTATSDPIMMLLGWGGGNSAPIGSSNITHTPVFSSQGRAKHGNYGGYKFNVSFTVRPTDTANRGWRYSQASARRARVDLTLSAPGGV